MHIHLIGIELVQPTRSALAGRLDLRHLFEILGLDGVLLRLLLGLGRLLLLELELFKLGNVEGLLGVERGDPRENLTLEKLERGAAAGGDEGHLVLHVELGGGRRRVAAADDAFIARGGRLRHGVKDGLGALGEVLKLEDAGGAVPDDLEC